MNPSFPRSLRRAFALLVLAVTVAGMPGLVAAQSFSLGGDFVSRYIWRGFDFGESFSVQPTLEFSANAVTVGTWASYSISADGAGANEHDLYVSIAAGPVSFGLTDYYFPSPGGADFFNFEDNGEGSHYLEPFVSFDGTDSVPVNFYIGTFLYNDPEKSTYIEASVPFTVADVELGLALGAIAVLDGDDADGSGLYGTTSDFAISNIGLSASKAVPITDRFSIPVSVAYIINPDIERTFLVFGISL